MVMSFACFGDFVAFRSFRPLWLFRRFRFDRFGGFASFGRFVSLFQVLVQAHYFRHYLVYLKNSGNLKKVFLLLAHCQFKYRVMFCVSIGVYSCMASRKAYEKKQTANTGP